MKRFILSFSFILSIMWSFAFGAERSAKFLPRIVKIEKEAELDSLESEGVDILRRRGDILLCLFPDADTRGGDVSNRFVRAIAPTLDKSKEFFNAGSIQTGKGVGVPFTGKGVVVGFCDIGIDPLHPTFLDADGRSRIKKLVQYVENAGIRIELEGDEAYTNWMTDNPDMYHATHVCGILAGGGAGTPYAGIAVDADIVATVSTLTEVGLLAGVEDIIDYAKEVGKPAVINISVGSYTGPHDGSSLFSQYLDMCAEEAVIVLSSGNEGSNKISLITDFTADMPDVAFRLGNKAWDQYKMYGVTDIWSGSASPISVSLGLYDSNEKRVVKWLDPFRLAEGENVSYCWSDKDYNVDSLPFDGELMAVGDIDPENGRHVTSLGYEFTSAERSSEGGWARYELAVRVSAEPGEDLEVYADGSYTRLMGISGNPLPSSVRSVSDLACGFNVISVGMYGNRDSVPMSYPEVFQDDGVYWESTGYVPGAAVENSSYGTLRDGRVTPLTTAPGADLMSAASRPFFQAYPFHPHLRLDGSLWVNMGGTSMASPYVAGYIATWLEAVPALTSTEIRRIIAESNRLDIENPDDPHVGAGYFDPVAGLKLALQSAGVEAVETPAGLFPADGYIEVYDAAGVKRYAGAASGLSGIGKGLYVVKSDFGVVKRLIR